MTKRLAKLRADMHAAMERYTNLLGEFEAAKRSALLRVRVEYRDRLDAMRAECTGASEAFFAERDRVWAEKGNR